MPIDMQAGTKDIAGNIEKRASEKYGVPMRLNLIRRKWHDAEPDVFARMADAADLCYDLSMCSHAFIERCRDPELLAPAFGIMEAMAEKVDGKRSAPGQQALYLVQVEDDPIVKIGVSSVPRKRFEQLQGAHYRDLAFRAIVFSPDNMAMTIEQRVLEWATELGMRLRGEWMAAHPDDVFAKVLEVARSQRIAICDAEVWKDNLLKRTKRLMRAPASLRPSRIRG